MPSDLTERNLKRAARLLADADALLITAGAGMGVDSGLPDFRGRDGFWRGYPALEKRGLTFAQMAQPGWFVDDPATAWAFYGHRQQLYRGTTPHDGFRMLLEWARAMRGGYFVATSNVDEQFEAAGFAAERVLAVHGTLFAYQCLAPCRKETWREEPLALDIDLETMQAGGRLPRCPHCGRVARPNVLLFDDGAWVSKDRDSQRGRYLHWLAGLKGRRVVVLEVGAGTAIPTIRRLGEDLVARGRATLVRVNPQASESDEPAIPVRMGALEALRRIEEALPDRCKVAVRAGVQIPRAASAGVQAVEQGPERLPPAERSRELEVVDLPRESDRGPDDSWQPGSVGPSDLEPKTGKIRLRLGSLTQVEMGRGLIGLVDTGSIHFDDESACMRSYVAAQTEWVPMPEVAGLSAPGYTMRAGIFHTPEYDAGGTPGIAIVFVQDPDERAVITLGIARRASDGPFLWGLLYRTAITKLAPLDYPQVPWVARRPDVDPSAYAEVMPYLKEFERTLAWGWLKVAAFIDATRRKRDGR